jgi:hypothetical protein
MKQRRGGPWGFSDGVWLPCHPGGCGFEPRHTRFSCLASMQALNSRSWRTIYYKVAIEDVVRSRSVLGDLVEIGKMSKPGPLRVRQMVLCTVCGILITGVFVSGLVWMTSLRERGWSKDPQTFGGQVTFIVTLVAIMVGAFAVNKSLNRRRYPR